MSKDATLAQGTMLERKDPTTGLWVEVPELTNINGPQSTKGEIRATTLRSTTEEYKGALPDPGRITSEMFYRGQLAIHQAIWLDFLDVTSPIRDWRVTYPDTTVLTATGHVAEMPRVAALNDLVKSTLTIRLSSISGG